jgi:hypothetical protein
METRPFNQWKQDAGNAPVEGARSACFWMPLNGLRPVILNDPAELPVAAHFCSSV